MYRVLLERGAEKDLARLSSEIHERVIAVIQALAMKPRPPACRKLAGSKHDWRIRVGDYRVVYEIADAIRVVRVKPRAPPQGSLSLRGVENGNGRKEPRVHGEGSEIYAKA